MYLSAFDRNPSVPTHSTAPNETSVLLKYLIQQNNNNLERNINVFIIIVQAEKVMASLVALVAQLVKNLPAMWETWV